MLQLVKISLWDGGVTHSLIAFAKARDIRLSSESRKESVIKVEMKRENLSSSVCDVPLRDHWMKVADPC